MTIRFRVAELRRAKGWTQQQLADAAAVSRMTVIRLESDESPPTRMDMDVLEKLAEVFEVEPGFLLVKVPARGKR
jgi:transcriptional regulator with XRE-family HTH domain